MKKQLPKKCPAFIVLVLMFSVNAKAQIVYTDLNPDASISCYSTLTNQYCNQSYAIDLNNDGINDFNLDAGTLQNGAGGGSGALISVSFFDSNKVAVNASSGLAKAIGINTKLSSSQTFAQSGSSSLKSTYSIGSGSGLWQNGVTKYLGVQLKVGSNYYNGWIRLSVSVAAHEWDASASFTVMDYAYNSIPNQTILAGETSCTVPTVTLSASGSLSFCAGDSVTLTANGTGYKYQWKKGLVNITGATAQTYVAKTAGTYKCRVTNSCGGITSSGKTVTVPCRTNEVFTEQLENPYEIRIAPNPLSNSATISFSLDQLKKVSLKIFDLNGRLVTILADKVFDDGEHSIDWKAEDVSAGIYFLQVQSVEFSKTEKLIVTK
jgi:hypothetical protein